MSNLEQMTTWRKIFLVSLVAIEQILRNAIETITNLHEVVITKMLDLVFYRGSPGEVSFGTNDQEDDYRVDGYVYFRWRDHMVYRVPFMVQNLPRNEVWSVRYVRHIATAAHGAGLPVLWIEHDDLIASATTAIWQKKDPRFDAIKNMFKLNRLPA